MIVRYVGVDSRDKGEAILKVFPGIKKEGREAWS